jgi:flagellar biosynthesis protein FliQ
MTLAFFPKLLDVLLVEVLKIFEPWRFKVMAIKNDKPVINKTVY